MKKVFLYAYDKVNLGDDLFIETIVNRYPQVQFYLWSDKGNRQVFRDLSNLIIIDKESKMISLIKKIRLSLVLRYKNYLQKKCDAVVYIGGSIFMEFPTWKNIVNWWKYQSENYPFYVLGANFGPYQTEEYRENMGKVFEKLKDVCFRDTYSKSLFSNIKTVRQAPDILFSCPVPKVHKIKHQIFFSVIAKHKSDQKEKENPDTYIDKMAEIVQGYLKDNYQVVLASFCEEEKDMDVAKAIGKKISEKYQAKLSYLSYDGINRNRFLRELASSEYIIASRFHGVILGSVAGRPVYPVIYSDKTKHVLEDLQFQGCYGDVRKLDELSYEESRKNLEQNILLKVEGLDIEAQKHFEKLDKILL
ncbi:MAG: polysaccharide pyruvyl transferase family protein [Anaerostipes sp.]|jgi:colanic acid/amylovoran biosynthesis protein